MKRKLNNTMGRRKKGKYYIIKRIENKIRRCIESSSIY
jgi:hypothetical protein